MNLNVLMPEVFINTGADEAIIMHYLKRGAIDFLTESEAWQETVSNTVAVDDAGFTINAGNNKDFLKVVSMKLGEDTLYPQTQGENQTGKTSHFYVDLNGVVVFNTPTLVAGTVTTKIVITPSGEEVADGVLTEYRDEIISACLAKMMIIPRKPWTDGNLAMIHDSKWQAVAAKAKRKVYVGASRTTLRTRPFTINGR